jgi:hypothetical protein
MLAGLDLRQLDFLKFTTETLPPAHRAYAPAGEHRVIYPSVV